MVADADDPEAQSDHPVGKFRQQDDRFSYALTLSLSDSGVVLPAATLQGLFQRRPGPWSGQRVMSPITAQRGCATGVYRRRRPERTLGYQVVQGWLTTWLAHHEEGDAESVPANVQRELSAYLECGILAHGFARAPCPDCTAEFLVAFSCKGRGVCPSCTSKRMAATAAHLIDSVIPRVPIRQWVLAAYRRHGVLDA